MDAIAALHVPGFTLQASRGELRLAATRKPALYVPVGEAGDILCPQCQRVGELIGAAESAPAATDGDDDLRPHAGGALHPDYPEFAATAARMLDDELCAAIGVADAEPTHLHFDAPEREALLGALSGEVARRLDRRAA